MQVGLGNGWPTQHFWFAAHAGQQVAAQTLEQSHECLRRPAHDEPVTDGEYLVGVDVQQQARRAARGDVRERNELVFAPFGIRVVSHSNDRFLNRIAHSSLHSV